MHSSRPLSSLRLPATTISLLTRSGYGTVQDLQNVTPEALAKDLDIALTDADTILSLSHGLNPTPSLAPPTLTQSAALLATRTEKISTGSPATDDLLSGGLARGEILEISGPPGTPKEAIAINIASSFVAAGHEVIFLDSQNMTNPAILDKALQTSVNYSPNYSRLIYHLRAQGLSELMIFIHNLPKLLEFYPKVALLVLNSISFPFQASPGLSIPARSSLLEKIKQVLTIVSTSRTVTIVATSQLSTKILNADGSSGSFDTGAKGVMAPQLGKAYLPGRAYRIILAAEGPTSGSISVSSTPGDPQGTTTSRSMLYELDGMIQ